MLFEDSTGNTFNSIELKFFKKRMGLSAKQFAFCITINGEMYIIGGCEDKDECFRKARLFVNKHKINVDVYYFARPEANKWVQNLIESVTYNIYDDKDSSLSKSEKSLDKYLHDHKYGKYAPDDNLTQSVQNNYINNILNKYNSEDK